jgi:hypothetical protein
MLPFAADKILLEVPIVVGRAAPSDGPNGN